MIVIALVIGVVFTFLIFIIFIAHKMTRPERNVGDWTPGDLGLEYQEICFQTEDGVDLKGWWMERGYEKTLICIHGYTASRWYEVYMRPLLNILKGEDYNILYFDLRAHGKSGGNRTTFGFKEHLDLEASLDWLESNYKDSCKKIGLIGYSMGGLVAIRGLVSDDRVDCAVADSPPIDMDSTSARSLKYFAGIPGWFYHLVRPAVRLLFGIESFDMYSLTGKVDKPLLLIAGKNDPIVDISEIRKFYKGSDNCVEWWSTEAEHVRSIQEQSNRYEKKISSFFEENMEA